MLVQILLCAYSCLLLQNECQSVPQPQNRQHSSAAAVAETPVKPQPVNADAPAKPQPVNADAPVKPQPVNADVAAKPQPVNADVAAKPQPVNGGCAVSCDALPTPTHPARVAPDDPPSDKSSVDEAVHSTIAPTDEEPAKATQNMRVRNLFLGIFSFFDLIIRFRNFSVDDCCRCSCCWCEPEVRAAQ